MKRQQPEDTLKLWALRSMELGISATGILATLTLGRGQTQIINQQQLHISCKLRLWAEIGPPKLVIISYKNPTDSNRLARSDPWNWPPTPRRGRTQVFGQLQSPESRRLRLWARTIACPTEIAALATEVRHNYGRHPA